MNGKPWLLNIYGNVSRFSHSKKISRAQIELYKNRLSDVSAQVLWRLPFGIHPK